MFSSNQVGDKSQFEGRPYDLTPQSALGPSLPDKAAVITFCVYAVSVIGLLGLLASYSN
jgi:hypothetical protein